MPDRINLIKPELVTAEANKIWGRAISESTPGELRLELDLYKKLLNFFQAGDYYYYIFNIRNYQIEFVSKEVEAVLGYPQSEVTVQFLMNKMHPEDRPWFLNFENKAIEFLTQLPVEKLMKYKRRYDFRLKKSSGEYVRILHQTMVIEHDEKGGLLRVLGLHTDITHLKPEGKPVFSIIGMDGEPSYLNIDVKKIFAISNEILTPREKEILGLLINGKLSKQIAITLNISKETVDRHRKNMLNKTGLNSTGELIAKSIRQGWI